MAKPTTRKPRQPSPQVRVPKPVVEVIDPRWLLKAGAVTIAAALLCAYLTLCLLVYQGQWQLVLHPDTTPPKAIPTAELPFQPVRFGATESGQPDLSGWWIPAPENSPRSGVTILFLHDASGNLATNLAPLQAFHAAGLNIFAFDYRGFGASAPPHPTEQRMAQDAAAALDYLTDTRHIPAATIVPYGAGLGAALALQLAATHPSLTAVVAETPVPDVLKMAHGDTRGSLVPLGLLFNQRFQIVPNLDTLKTPKLLLTAGPSPVSTQVDPNLLASVFKQAATPSIVAHLDRPSGGAIDRSAWTEALTRFLDQFVPTPPAQLKPLPTRP